jgi:two-component system phosphate regulon response regulator PhoB
MIMENDLKQIRILIADDEPNQLELIRFNLSQENFEVTIALDGEQTLLLAQDILPDIVILDWMMPRMSGIEVCRNLRSNQVTKEIPIIMLSARGEEGDRTLGLDSGADDYITKPFSPRELLSRIKAVLRRTSPFLTSKVLEYGDLHLDLSKKYLEILGEKIILGPKEFEILSLLMKRPGQVYSRAQLLDNIWGHGIDVGERTIDVHITRLRKALNGFSKKAARGTVIRTVRSSGYALETDKI